MHNQTNIPLADIKTEKRRYAIACQKWRDLDLKEKQQQLKDLGFNKVYAHRDLPYQMAHIRRELIDCMNLIN